AHFFGGNGVLFGHRHGIGYGKRIEERSGKRGAGRISEKPDALCAPVHATLICESSSGSPLKLRTRPAMSICPLPFRSARCLPWLPLAILLSLRGRPVFPAALRSGG